MQVEWRIPNAETPLSQGDILICRDPKKGIVEAISLIITADCDISKNKFGTHLACLRIVSFHEYLRTVWANRKLARAVEKETENIRVQLNKWNSRRIGDAMPLSSDTVMNWVRRSESDTICRDLGMSDTDAAKLKLKINLFRSALESLDDKRAFDSFTQLVAFHSTLSNKNRDDCLQEALQQAKGDELPDDIFLLPSLPQLDVGSAVVLLREIVGIPAKVVCFRTLDAISKEFYLRIGRLEPTFKYAVSQAFGSLFSRIGLPEAYEARRETAIEQITTYNWD